MNIYPLANLAAMLLVPLSFLEYLVEVGYLAPKSDTDPEDPYVQIADDGLSALAAARNPEYLYDKRDVEAFLEFLAMHHGVLNNQLEYFFEDAYIDSSDLRFHEGHNQWSRIVPALATLEQVCDHFGISGWEFSGLRDDKDLRLGDLIVSLPHMPGFELISPRAFQMIMDRSQKQSYEEPEGEQGIRVLKLEEYLGMGNVAVIHDEFEALTDEADLAADIDLVTTAQASARLILPQSLLDHFVASDFVRAVTEESNVDLFEMEDFKSIFESVEVLWDLIDRDNAREGFHPGDFVHPYLDLDQDRGRSARDRLFRFSEFSSDWQHFLPLFLEIDKILELHKIDYDKFVEVVEGAGVDVERLIHEIDEGEIIAPAGGFRFAQGVFWAKQ